LTLSEATGPAIAIISFLEIPFLSARFLIGIPLGLLAALERSRETPTRRRLNGEGGSWAIGEIHITPEPIEQLISVEAI